MTITTKIGGAVTKAFIGSGNEETNDETEVAFRDAEELREAFRDPRYQTSAWFRARVQEAVAAGMNVHDAAPTAHMLDGGQLNGRHQVRGNPIDEAPTAERELSDHDRAMIDRAEKAGL